MINTLPRNGRIWLAPLPFLLTCWIAAATARSAEVRVELSNEKTYVGLPVALRIQIRDSSYHDPPELKEVDGLKIRRAGPPSSSSNTQIVQDANGFRRLSTSTITYTFNVTPLRAGTFTLAPTRVSADGVATVTKALTIEVAESQTGDLLMVEIDANRIRYTSGSRWK